MYLLLIIITSSSKSETIIYIEFSLTKKNKSSQKYPYKTYKLTYLKCFIVFRS